MGNTVSWVVTTSTESNFPFVDNCKRECKHRYVYSADVKSDSPALVGITCAKAYKRYLQDVRWYGEHSDYYGHIKCTIEQTYQNKRLLLDEFNA